MWKISNQQHNLQLRTKESSSEKTSRSETICSMEVVKKKIKSAMRKIIASG
jgi:hypothetical protein